MTGAKRQVIIDYIAALVWTLVIYASINYTVPILRFLGSNLGGDNNLNILFAGLLFAALAAVGWKLVRRPGFGTTRACGAAALLAVYGYFMWSMEIPAEKIHFLEYGILAALMFRALRHHIPHPLVYAVTFAVCYVIGLSDEYIQTFTPWRVGEIVDTFWNLLACGLAILGLAFVWIPEGLDGRSRKGHWLTFFLVWTVAIIACAAFMENLSDFGHKLTDPDIGRFNSAFTAEEFLREDAMRGTETAGLMDATDDTGYNAFLRIHTPKNDPYTHEARVHIFRRDRYLRKSGEPDDAPTDTEKARLLHIAVMENRILEKYYPTLLANSKTRAWGKEKIAELETYLSDRRALNPDYESAVGARMITRVDKQALWSGVAGSVAVLLLLCLWAGRHFCVKDRSSHIRNS